MVAATLLNIVYYLLKTVNIKEKLLCEMHCRHNGGQATQPLQHPSGTLTPTNPREQDFISSTPFNFFYAGPLLISNHLRLLNQGALYQQPVAR